MKLNVNLIGLCVSMLVSVWFLIVGHLYYGWSHGVVLMILMLFPGLAGLYFSTKIKSAKLKWLLLVINYLFATALTAPPASHYAGGGVPVLLQGK